MSLLALLRLPTLLHGLPVLDLHTEGQTHVGKDLANLLEGLAAKVLGLEHLCVGLLNQLTDEVDVRVLQAVRASHRQLELFHAAEEVLVEGLFLALLLDGLYRALLDADSATDQPSAAFFFYDDDEHAAADAAAAARAKQPAKRNGSGARTQQPRQQQRRTGRVGAKHASGCCNDDHHAGHQPYTVMPWNEAMPARLECTYTPGTLDLALVPPDAASAAAATAVACVVVFLSPCRRYLLASLPAGPPNARASQQFGVQLFGNVAVLPTSPALQQAWRGVAQPAGC